MIYRYKLKFGNGIAVFESIVVCSNEKTAERKARYQAKKGGINEHLFDLEKIEVIEKIDPDKAYLKYREHVVNNKVMI